MAKPHEDVVTTTQSHSVGDVEADDDAGTHRGLKSRHAQMLALGGTIGTGLFVGSGQALQMGGPGFLLAAYGLTTLFVYGIITATTEINAFLPVRGSSVALYAARFVSPSLGFALGWMYWYVFAITVPAEVTAVGLVVQFWPTPGVPLGAWLALSVAVVVALNLFPVRVYGEAEFWFASVKVLGLLALFATALVLVAGGAPSHDALGFRYWADPGPVKQYLGIPGAAGRAAALLATTAYSVFAFAFAPELLVVTGGEMESPRRNLPVAGRHYFYRLLFFYVLGVFFIGLIVSSDNPRLLGGATSTTGASPWVIAVSEAGIAVFPSVINAVILTSAWSSANSYLYMASRALYSLALVGNAPAVFARCNRFGVPYYATALSASISLLAFMNLSSSSSTVFNWFVNLINTGAYQSWLAICILYIRFRRGADAQRIADLPYRSRLQPYFAYASAAFFGLLLLLSGFRVFLRGHWDASAFLTSYVGIPVFAALYLGHRCTAGRADPWAVAPADMDFVSGLDQVLRAERPPRAREGRARVWEKLRAVFE